MEHQEFDAPEELRDAILCFWYTRMDFGKVPSRFEVLPDGYAEIVFHFGGTCSVSYGGEMQPLPSPFLMGLLDQPVLLHTQGTFEVIGIRCFPWTVFDLLGLPSGKGGVHVFEHPIAQIHSVLRPWMEAGNVAGAVAEVRRYFLEARSRVAIDSMLYQAGVAMREANGTMPVSEVAAAAYATVRTLERKFKQSSGHTVKDVSGVMRFEQVRNQLWTNPDSNLAGMAQELGYTDQSHLSREFKRYSGTTPSAFARKAREGKRTLGDDFVAFVQSSTREHPL